MANAVYRSSSSTRKNRDHERIRGNARLTSVESEARALLLARNDDTKEQNNVAPPPPLSSAPSSPTPHEAASPTADAAPTSQMTSSGKANAKTADHTEEHVITAHAKAEQKEQEKTSARIRVKETRPGGRKKEVPQHRENSGGWALQLTPSLVLMLVVFELVTLSFFFLFGLIIGKGTVPPPPQAELERILPTEENRTERTQEILPQEELRFMANLKADESATERQQPAAAPNGGRPEPQKSENSVLADDSNLYDFVIRVAAFKSDEQADALRARLEGAGMRTRIKNEKAQKGTWSFVLILFRGTEVKMNQMRETLPGFGLRDSIIVSKTAVQTR